ncbi:hypothetical protein HK104_007747 [Borealophlyctis nickersoniae]|nr:hypothetical protein HK104_007747 [Borealophlyctis nickersoniae]
MISLSRKGFDSGAGGYPSPIINNRAYSIPIPASKFRYPTDRTRYRDITFPDGINMGEIVEDLTRGKIKADAVCHFDPFLWDDPRGRPVLGHSGASQSHLKMKGFGPGCTFLFYGWFRDAEKVDGVWRYVRGAPDRHVIFGYMNVSQCLPVDDIRDPLELGLDPNFAHFGRPVDPFNTLYMSPKSMIVQGRKVPGAGLIPVVGPTNVLTRCGETRRMWELPEFLHPTTGVEISCNKEINRWSLCEGRCELKSAMRGQEFVIQGLDAKKRDEWLASILRDVPTLEEAIVENDETTGRIASAKQLGTPGTKLVLRMDGRVIILRLKRTQTDSDTKFQDDNARGYGDCQKAKRAR